MNASPHVSPVQDRTPTRPMLPSLSGRIEIELADGDAVARFLELVANVARAKGRIVVIVE